MIIFPKATATITHSAVDTTYLCQVQLRSVENGVDTATVTIEDRQGSAFPNISERDAITIKTGDARDASLTTRLTGSIYRVDPQILTEGNILKLECDGAGYGLDSMRVCEEYGSQSKNATLDTIAEILEDNTNGIIDAYTNKIFNGAASGFSYTTQVEDIVGAIPYVSYPYKICSKSVNDLCDIIQSIKGAAAGCHWRVDPSSRFLLATIANHGAPASTYWTTYWNTTQALSTFTEGKNIQGLNIQQLPLEANYVIYQGAFKKPANGDLWTENNSALWGENLGTASDDNTAGYFIVGDYSLLFDAGGNVNMDIYYPSTQDAAWDITSIESKEALPQISFYWRKNNLLTEANTAIRLFTTAYATDYFQAKFCEYADDDYKWTHCSLPIGNFWKTKDEGRLYRWTVSGSPDWSNINGITFHTSSANGAKLWIDNLCIEGTAIRVASQAAGYSAADPCRMKIISDNVGKDDSLNASDDSGLMAKLAYAEYLRSKSTPYVGTLIVDLHPEIVGGQLIHLHAKKTASGTYGINSDFRVTKATHDIFKKQTCTSLEITSDILNSLCRPVPNNVNKIYECVKPESQDREAANYKLGELNINHPRLVKTY